MSNLEEFSTSIEEIRKLNFETNTTTSTTVFNPKKYLNTRLEANETSKNLKIRILPISAEEKGVFFKKVHMHVIQVDKAVSPSGWKSVVCLSHNDIKKPCPICQIATDFFNQKKAANSEEDIKIFNNAGKAHLPRVMWIVRVIDRDHEEDGVKFWLFNDSLKKDGIKDKITTLYDKRANGALKTNIFDLVNGKDLEITITQTINGRKFDVADDEVTSPLSENTTQALEWINDTTSWRDLYKEKPYEYLYLLAKNKIPYFDKESGLYISKEEYEAKKNGVQQAKKEEFATQPLRDLSQTPPQSVMEDVKIAQAVASSTANITESLENDLPF